MQWTVNPLGFLAVALLVFLSNPASHAATPTGTVTGRVWNAGTGQFLNNAQISVRGTEVTRQTDETGKYIFPALPGGPITLLVSYTGLDSQEVTISVSPGQTVERDIGLTSAARYGGNSATVRMDAVVTTAVRDTDADAIAVNEQRYAANIKNVISTDALGTVTDGNVGEFLKYLPGITAEYDTESGAGVASVSVRGFPTHMAVVSSDGLQLANTGNPTGTSRVFQFTQASINNTARIEVTKVPLPSTAADSMAGSVNLVSKSAFERSKAQLRVSFGLTANYPFIDLQKTPHTNDRNIYKMKPSGNFDYTLPLTKNLGFVITGQSENRYMYHQSAQKAFVTTLAGTSASVQTPLMQQFTLAGNAPRENERNSLAIKADWRVTPHGVLSVNAQASRFVADRFANSVTYSVGTAATSTIAGGVPLTFGPDFASGATGRGSIAWSNNLGASVRQRLEMRGVSARYRHDDGNWRIDGAVGVSRSAGGYEDASIGRFRQFDVVTREPVRVVFSEINGDRPQRIEVFDNAGRPFDYQNLENFTLRTTSVSPRKLANELQNGKLDVRKNIAAAPFPTAVQLGGAWRKDVRDNRREGYSFTYNGPDGNAATPDSPAPYAMRTYVNQEESFGFRSGAYISPEAAWSAFQANPRLFSQTAAQVVAQERGQRRDSERFQESVYAPYAQFELGLLRNRLKVVTGVRYEETDIEGEGVLNDPAAVWQRNADGSFVRNAAGARVRRSDAGAAGSLEEIRLTFLERQSRVNRTFGGYYPSLHFTYQAREHTLVRLAYAKTYGRPDLTNVVPNSVIDENDTAANPSLSPGRITVRNTALTPWTADNLDLSVEYYTPSGGVFTAGAFLKSIKNFFGSVEKLATLSDLDELGLDPMYEGWELATSFNLPGTAQVRGVEVSVRHSLQPLGTWGKYFQVFANGTKLELDGQKAANFSAFIPESANWGFSFSNRRWNVMSKWNYRGLQRRGAASAVLGYNYIAPRTMLDVNVEVRLRKDIHGFINVQNITNVLQRSLSYGDATPTYARQTQVMEYGPQMFFGVKGTF